MNEKGPLAAGPEGRFTWALYVSMSSYVKANGSNGSSSSSPRTARRCIGSNGSDSLPIWIAFVALSPDLCPHVAPLQERPLRSRGWCDSCADVVVWCESTVERRLTPEG